MCSFIIESNLLGRTCSPSCGGITSRTTIEIFEVVLAGEVGTVSVKRGTHIEVDSALVNKCVELGTERGGWGGMEVSEWLW